MQKYINKYIEKEELAKKEKQEIKKTSKEKGSLSLTMQRNIRSCTKRFFNQLNKTRRWEKEVGWRYREGRSVG